MKGVCQMKNCLGNFHINTSINPWAKFDSNLSIITLLLIDALFPLMKIGIKIPIN